MMPGTDMSGPSPACWGAPTPLTERQTVVLIPMFGAHATVFGFDPACDRIDLRQRISALDIELRDDPSGCTILVKFGPEARQSLTLAGVSCTSVSEGTFLNMGSPSRTSVVRQLSPRWSPPLSPARDST